MKAGFASLTIALSILMLMTLSDCADDDDDASDHAALPDDDLDDDLNDDAQLPDPWENMEPTGKMIDDILAISSHISKSTTPGWSRDCKVEKLVDAGVSMLRTDFKWDYMESADDQWNFAGYDIDLSIASPHIEPNANDKIMGSVGSLVGLGLDDHPSIGHRQE
jgi:hypothetical protein